MNSIKNIFGLTLFRSVTVAYAVLVSFFGLGQTTTESNSNSLSGQRETATLQETETQQSTKTSTTTMTFSDPVEGIWEFGLKVNCRGDAKGVVGYVPIPMDWPEQTVEIVAEEKTDRVGRIRKSNPTQFTSQFTFAINRIKAAEAECYIRFNIKKRMILAPKDTSGYVFAKRVPSKLRTFLKPSPYIESKHKRIKEIAKSLTDEKLSSWEQVEKIYTWVRENVEYEFDVQIHSCLDALDKKKGDCEELSSLFIAICRASGIPARAVWVPGHTYPEFYLEDKDRKGHWFPCQVAGDYEFGSMSELKPILQKGDRFKMEGHADYVRYLQATLIAKNLDGEVSIEPITRQVEAEK
ncbi:MAG: transglutaminase family protein [Mariniblastus sp.]